MALANERSCGFSARSWEASKRSMRGHGGWFSGVMGDQWEVMWVQWEVMEVQWEVMRG